MLSGTKGAQKQQSYEGVKCHITQPSSETKADSFSAKQPVRVATFRGACFFASSTGDFAKSETSDQAAFSLVRFFG
jgi:hypothetical protein